MLLTADELPSVVQASIPYAGKLDATASGERFPSWLSVAPTQCDPYSLGWLRRRRMIAKTGPRHQTSPPPNSSSSLQMVK